MRSFKVATATCLTHNTSIRTSDLTFAACSRVGDIDPNTEVVRRMFAGFRRALVVQDKADMIIKGIFETYTEEGHPGTCKGYGDPSITSMQSLPKRITLRSKL